MYSRLYPLDDNTRYNDTERVEGTDPVHAIVLLTSGDKKIQVIKVVREITGLGLGDAMVLVDRAPRTVLDNVTLSDALRAKEQLEEFGATVEVRRLFRFGLT